MIARIKSVSRQLAFALPILVLCVAFVAHAQAACTGSNCLNDPTAFTNWQDFFAAALKGFVKVSLPIITVFIVLSGFQFVTAQGNQEKLSVAKRNFFFVLLGALLILSCLALSNILAGTVSTLTVGN